MKNDFQSLPNDIAHDIALRLPIRSLLNLKCTCKFWHRFVSDPEFIDMHLSRAIENPGYIVHWQEKKSTSSNNRRSSIEGFLREKVGANHVEVNKFSSPLFHLFKGDCEIFSSGGLIALYAVKDHCFYVFNPLLREQAIKVPDSQVCDFRFGRDLWGFGYCSSTKEYKIVKVFTGITKFGQVYTVNGGDHDQTWRTITYVPDCLPRPATRPPLEFNETLFWINHDKYHGTTTIMSFDFETETFKSEHGPQLSKTTYSELIVVGSSSRTIALVETFKARIMSVWFLRGETMETVVDEYRDVDISTSLKAAISTDLMPHVASLVSLSRIMARN